MIGLHLMIAIAVITGSIGLAKRGRPKRRWNPNNAVVRITTTKVLSTLASKTILLEALTVVSGNEYRAISLKIAWSLQALTAGEGPVHVGVAHGDYTVTEVDEWMESQSSMSRGNLIEHEKASRKIRLVGTFSGEANESLNNGRPIRTKLNWAVVGDEVINLFIYNGGAAPLTTGGVLGAVGSIFLRWT